MNRNQALIAAVLAHVCWGLLGPFGKILLVDFSPFTMNAWRMLITSAMILPFVKKETWVKVRELARDRILLVVVAIGGGIDFSLYALAIDRLDATYATLGFYSAPLWTAALGLLLKERAGKWFLPAVAGMLAGSFLVLAPGGKLPPGFDTFGMVLAVLSGLGWAIYGLGLRWRAQELDLAALMVLSFIVATIYFVAIALPFSSAGDWTSSSPKVWTTMVLHALIPTIGALILYNASIQHLQATTVNLLVGVELAATLAWSAMILGDTFSGVQLLGIGIVLTAVSGYIWSRSRGRAASPEPTPAT